MPCPHTDNTPFFKINDLKSLNKYYRTFRSVQSTLTNPDHHDKNPTSLSNNNNAINLDHVEINKRDLPLLPIISTFSEGLVFLLLTIKFGLWGSDETN
jgi:hypothetical protein